MRHRSVAILSLLALLFGCFRSQEPAQPVPPHQGSEAASITELTTKVDEAVRSYMEENHLPGVAVVLVRDGKLILQRGYGLANVEQGIAVDPDKTLFRIGSISKALTLLTLTRLVDDGRLDLKDDVADYFEGIENPHSFEQPVTIWNLLTHTTGFDQIGLNRQIGFWDRPLEERKAERPSLAEFLRAKNLRRVSLPGQYFRYDTYGTTLAGAIIEGVTGLTYGEAMKQEIFEPLGMTNSFVEADSEHMNSLALGYGYVDGAYVPQPYEVYVTLPASSIDATPADMSRLLQALTGGGANAHSRFFSAETTEAVLAEQFRPHPEFLGVTHGLRESYASRDSDQEPLRAIGHGGSMLGFNADLTLIPELNLGMFAITNRNGEAGGGRVRIGRQVLEAVIETLHDNPVRQAALPTPVEGQDLSDYAGDYRYGVYCHSCSPEEFEQGAWRPGDPWQVTWLNDSLLIRDDQFLPQGEDVFVRADGQRKVFFGRNEEGQVSYFVFSTSVDTFERVME